MSHNHLSVFLLAGFAFAAPVSAQQFEPAKLIVQDFAKAKLDLGASFLQSYQNLSHSNTALSAVGTDGADANQLADIGGGFNLAAANLNLSAQLTPGIKVVLENYMSSRHHNEFWVKGGYLQIDESPIKLLPLEMAMAVLTIKAGHYEVNYGDAHYRRTDNGSGLANPFAENLILDAFTTEIGGEVIARMGPVLGVFGVTGGQNKGDIMAPEGRSWAFVSKLGVDHRFNDNLRVRLTGSSYQNDNAGRATLYGGDRAGSGYWGVMDNAKVAAFTNGRVDPKFTEEIRAYQLNPFVQLGNLEAFGVIELARGQTQAEQTAGAELREVRQYAVDGVYRLLDDKVYIAGRYNTVTGELSNIGEEQTVERKVAGAGWFITPNLQLKGEYVRQNYRDFAPTNILNGGKFNGIVVQGLVSF
jgi:hypothetical protein